MPLADGKAGRVQRSSIAKADGPAPAAPLSDETPAASGPAPEASLAPDGSPVAGYSPVLPTAPKLEVPVAAPRAEEPAGRGGDNEAGPPARQPPGGNTPRPRQGQGGALRPAAPRAPTVEPRSVGFYVVACVAFVLVVGIAIAAWRLRDHPEQVAAARTATSAPETPGKIVDRVGGDKASTPARDAEPAGDAAVVPAPIPQSGEPPVAPAAGAPGAPNAEPAEPAVSAAAIPVSQRAALLVDAPEDPQKVKTYVGSVVWRSESVSPGQGQPLSTAVRADVDIPEAKLTMSMVLKKNLEPQFPASHTMEFHFTELPGNTLGPVKQINVPEMRKDDSAPTGEPLTGVPVSITDDYFLVGLSRGGAEAPNLQMITDRNWIDLSVLLKSGKVAKITFEKGTSGQHVIEDALKSWQ